MFNQPETTNLLKDKWNRTSLVSTDYQETKFIPASGKPFDSRKIPEKYTYYYHTLEIEEIIQDWKRRCPPQIELVHLAHPINSKGLLQLVKPEVSQKLNKIHHLKIRNKNTNGPKKQALFIAGTHAREVASVTALIAFVDHLLTNNPDLLDGWNLDVVPLVNPLGYYLDNNRTSLNNGQITNHKGNYHRKNDRNLKSLIRSPLISDTHSPNRTNDLQSGRCGANILSNLSSMRAQQDIGVDLNRNSGMDFVLNGQKCNGWIGGGSGEINPGPSPNSERETQIFQNIFNSLNPDLFVTLHGYGNMIVTSDMYDDSRTMSSTLKNIQQKYKITFNPANNVPSCYTFSQFLTDMDFYQSIIKGVAIKKQTNNQRATGETIQMPLAVSPLGTATGDMTYWSYIAKQQLNSNKKYRYCGFTLELGSSSEDNFYPNKYQMIDIVYNAWTVLTNSLLNFPAN